VIVHAAMTMLVLIGLSAFVVDHGVLWLGREQAQDAADAGAIAGAIARAYDDIDDPPSAASTGIVHGSVTEVVRRNPVWFNEAFTTAGVSYVCPPGAERCVRVDVYRDGTESSVALPVFFGPVLGITSQPVRATATAQVAVGNGTTCLKPWAIPDKWIEGSVPADDNFKKQAAGPNRDEYRPPTADPPGGYAFPDDLGRLLTLSFAHPEGNEPITAGFLLPLVLPGANTYEQNIAGCNGQLVTFDRNIEVATSAVEAATNAGFQALFDLEPAASWVDNNVNSCAPVCAPISPRLVALAVFDVEQYEFMRVTGNWAACVGFTGPSGQCVKVVNIVGFFIQDVAGGVITGRLARYPGRVWADSPTLTSLSSFLPAITLVR
jgi:hypothetical protein